MTTSRLAASLPHATAIVAAVLYAWAMSRTAHFQTGLQFIAPVAILLTVHLIWMALSRDLTPGFSRRAVRRSALSAALLMVALMIGSVVAPMPATADSAGALLTGIFCLGVIAVVVFLVIFAIVLVFRLLRWLFRKPKSDEDIFSDYGSLILVFSLLGLASLEGLSGAYSFDGRNTATATRHVDAPPAAVWQTMETATSAAFALPQALQLFPQPAEVEVDEGTTLGANRVVRMRGREGEGRLTLRVTDRSDTTARFTVLSDTTPIANWVRHHSITYTVTPDDDGTRLQVTLDYDRELAPAWFFDPLMKAAAWGAMDVLARDVRLRAQQ